MNERFLLYSLGGQASGFGIHCEVVFHCSTPVSSTHSVWVLQSSSFEFRLSRVSVWGVRLELELGIDLILGSGSACCCRPERYYLTLDRYQRAAGCLSLGFEPEWVVEVRVKGLTAALHWSRQWTGSLCTGQLVFEFRVKGLTAALHWSRQWSGSPCTGRQAPGWHS